MEFLDSPPSFECSYSDVFLVPGRSAVTSRFEVSLVGSGRVPLKIPVVASNMTAVTGVRMAVALARRGGLAVLPQDLSDEELVAGIRAVKDAEIDFDPACSLAPDDSVADAVSLIPARRGMGVALLGTAGEYLGFVPAERLAGALAGSPLSDLALPSVPVVSPEQLGPAESNFALLASLGHEVLPVVSGGTLVGTVSKRGSVRASIYQANVDAGGRLAVAAAIGINNGAEARARRLTEAGVDVLVVDVAHGHQDRVGELVSRLTSLGVPVVAGNVVTAAAVRDLAAAGVAAVKVGVGPGAMCTTRMMTGVGRPQFSAVLETALAARELGVDIWADGGVRFPRDVALALAAGAEAVMIGSWFAGTVESPGRIRYDGAKMSKESWGMASTRAVHARTRHENAFSRARKELFAEGISTSRIPIDPDRPSVDDLLDAVTAGVRSAMSYAGATTLAEFRERAVVGVQSASGYEEGKATSEGW